jgi:hypothetical protein
MSISKIQEAHMFECLSIANAISDLQNGDSSNIQCNLRELLSSVNRVNKKNWGHSLKNIKSVLQKCDKCVTFKYKIKCYVDHRDRNEVQEVYDDGTAELQAEFEVAMSYLRELGRQEWTRPKAAKLNKCKEFKDFFEIRFKADNLQQRPIGYFGPGKDEFTILIWVTEKGGKLIPETWCSTATNRKKQIENGTASVKCIRFEGDEQCTEQK